MITQPSVQVVVDAPVGAASDESAIVRLGGRRRRLTFEHEHVPNALLDRLEAAGVAVHPDAAALVHAQDKIVMRTRLTALGVPSRRGRPAVAGGPRRASSPAGRGWSPW